MYTDNVAQVGFQFSLLSCYLITLLTVDSGPLTHQVNSLASLYSLIVNRRQCYLIIISIDSKSGPLWSQHIQTLDFQTLQLSSAFIPSVFFHQDPSQPLPCLLAIAGLQFFYLCAFTFLLLETLVSKLFCDMMTLWWFAWWWVKSIPLYMTVVVHILVDIHLLIIVRKIKLSSSIIRW